MSQKFLKEQESLWTNTVKLSDVVSRVSEFDAIFYVGGHGRMYPIFYPSIPNIMLMSISGL